jgi:hypothetical protein
MKTRRQHSHSEIREQHSAFVSTVITTREVTKAIPEFICKKLAFLTLFFPLQSISCVVKLK